MTRTDFDGETVLVTGASSGFGAAVARRFHAAGARVVAAARRRERLEALAGELGDRVLPFALDLADPAAVAAAPDSLSEPIRDVSILVNNAGFGIDRGPAQAADLADWDAMIAVNVTGLLHVTHAFLPRMLARGRGQIVNIGSVAGQAAGPGGAVYSATKAFVRQFSNNLKSDLIATPVRVAYIAPGAAETEFSPVRWRGDAAKAGKIYEGHEGMTAEDVAETVFFAASLPPRVDVSELEIMPHAQGFGPRIFARK